MSQRLRAALFTTDANGQRVPLVDFRMSIHSGWFELDSATTGADGFFTLEYTGGGLAFSRPRQLLLIAHDAVGRELPIFSVEPADSRFDVQANGRVGFEDLDQLEINEGDIFFVREKDATGFLVTLGTGQTPVTDASGTATPATGWGLSRGNAVNVLADRDVFKHAASILGAAQQSILLSQFNFGVPGIFNPDPAQEVPRVVFDFPLPRPDPAHFFHVGPNDPRPERLLLAALDRNVDVRIIAHAVELPLILKIIVAVLAFPFAGTDGFFAGLGLLDDVGPADELQDYFKLHPKIRVQPFKMPVFNAGIMHTRMTVVDGRHGMCAGASYIQSYIDTHLHALDAETRGASDGLPDHDVGIGVTGPAVADLHRNLQLLWNNTEAADKLTTPPPIPPSQTSGGDAICSLQIVRTITEDRIADPVDTRLSKGEHGILEGYLRAIANAEDFIYFENQYFIERRIGDALVDAMKKRPNLQAILVVNIKPDVWYFLYPWRQRRLITKIREAIGETPDQPKRFGVFTRWTHDTAPVGYTRPGMLPIEIHAKVGIVDDKWATVGSANLDYASMDRAIEVNANLLSGVDGEPVNDAVSLLRRKLWAEHLGFFDAAGEPTPSDAVLVNRPADGWLSLWTSRTTAALHHLRTTPEVALAANMARLLPWPSDDETHPEPNDYLRALSIPVHPKIPHSVVPLKSTRAFDFFTGTFKTGSKAQADY